MRFVLVLAALVAYVSSETALEEFTAGNHQFTSNLYREVLKQNPNGNFIFSPLSAEIILALTQAGAKGQTAQEFTTALNLPTTQQKTQEALSQFLPKLHSTSDDLKLLSANRLFLGQDLKIKDSFQQLATSVYEASAVNVNFGNAQTAANTINSWVEDQTNNKIKNLIDPSSIDDSTRLVLVNALYFKAKWRISFEEYQTRKQKFYLTQTNTKEVDMMHVEDNFRYYECTKRNVKFLELPYVGNNITMTIVLPNEIQGLAAIENDISSYLKSPPYTHERVSVSLPRWTVDSTTELAPILKKLGLVTAFGQADFSNLSDEPLAISDVIQKAFINVTESGTEAAAATADKIFQPYMFLPPTVVFQADHPFIYFIQFNGNMTLLTGKVQTFTDLYDIFYKCC